MRIAQVAPLCESVPARHSGGAARLISYLTESLVEAGHDVTLFATGDSRTSATLHSLFPSSICQGRLRHDPALCQQLQLEEVLRLADHFDLIHFHNSVMHFPVFRRMQAPQVTTLYGRLDSPDLREFFDEYQEMPVVSLSCSQRLPVPNAAWAGTVYAGLPKSTLSFQAVRGGYFLSLGRVSRRRGIDRAIRLATGADVPLLIAGRIHEADHRYFEEEIRPSLSRHQVEYIGEVNGAEKNTLLGGAKALLALGEPEEVSPLPLVEAMACGTPVIALSGGTAEEYVLDGVSGRIVDTLPDAIRAACEIALIDRQECRDYYESQFSTGRMVDEYQHIYHQILQGMESVARRDHLQASGWQKQS